MRAIRLALAAILLVTLLTLVVQNMSFVELRFVVWTIGVPIALPVVGAYLLGAWTGGSLFAFLKRERNDLRHKPPMTAGQIRAQR